MQLDAQTNHKASDNHQKQILSHCNHFIQIQSKLKFRFKFCKKKTRQMFSFVSGLSGSWKKEISCVFKLNLEKENCKF